MTSGMTQNLSCLCPEPNGNPLWSEKCWWKQMPFPANIWSPAVCAALNRGGLQNCLEPNKVMRSTPLLFPQCFLNVHCETRHPSFLFRALKSNCQISEFLLPNHNIIFEFHYPTTVLHMSNCLDS